MFARHGTKPDGGSAMKVTAIVHHEEDEGIYWAEVPALPGCITQGSTLEQLQERLTEAATGWVEAHNIHAEKNTPEGTTTMEIEI